MAAPLEKCLSISINCFLHLNAQEEVRAWQGTGGPDLVQLITTTQDSRVPLP